MAEHSRRSNESRKNTLAMVEELAGELRRGLADARKELHEAAGEVIVAAQQSTDPGAKKREEEATALQELLAPVLTEAESALARLSQRSLHATSRLGS